MELARFGPYLTTFTLTRAGAIVLDTIIIATAIVIVWRQYRASRR